MRLEQLDLPLPHFSRLPGDDLALGAKVRG